jgi:hypothetical protein
MSATISLTDSAVLTVLRTFLLGILPTGTPVIRGQDNRVPEPESSDFCVMTPIMRTRLATNCDRYADDASFNNIQTNTGNNLTDQSGNALFVTPQPAGFRNSEQATELTVQLDFHGPNSGDNAQIASTLFRDEYATTVFSDSGIDAAPLYSNDPRQTPFWNGENQIESRWSVDVAIQINPVVTTSQDFANGVTLTLHEIP